MSSHSKKERDMYSALVYYPEFDERTRENIQAFRRKYDSFVDYWEPHMTFIFPVPCSEVDETRLIEHIERVLKKWKPFPIRIAGLKKSWDHWLLLLLKEGNEKVTALHDELYSGILSPYLRKDIEYLPRIGLALFARKDADYNALDPRIVDLEEKLYRQALGEAGSLKIDSFGIIDRLSLNRAIINVNESELVYEPIDKRVFKLPR